MNMSVQPSLDPSDGHAADEMIPLVYDELHRLASHYFRRERAGHTLQPTAIIHEAYLRLIGEEAVHFQNRAHFMGIAARVMRRVLVDHCRERGRAKRGGNHHRVTLTDMAGLGRDPDLVALDDALESLAQIDQRKARVVELRYFGGLTIDEIAGVMDVSPRQISREWRRARAWLFQALA